jgi:hypothetical protein
VHAARVGLFLIDNLGRPNSSSYERQSRAIGVVPFGTFRGQAVCDTGRSEGPGPDRPLASLIHRRPLMSNGPDVVVPVAREAFERCEPCGSSGSR